MRETIPHREPRPDTGGLGLRAFAALQSFGKSLQGESINSQFA